MHGKTNDAGEKLQVTPSFEDAIAHKGLNKVLSGGGGYNYYDLPPNAEQLQDLIEHRNMNGSVKDIFKACYRIGLKDGTTDVYDVEKMVYYSLRELGRLLNRKDYLTLAEEVIGHQSKELNRGK